jgi:Ca2+-binding RTX toxin-like protein
MSILNTLRQLCQSLQRSRRLSRAVRSGTSQRSKQSSCLPRLEHLEERQVPTTLTTFGGHLLTNVKADAVYFGLAWTSNSVYRERAGQLNTFLSEITNSPYMDMLHQYGGIGRGSFEGSDFTNNSWTLHSTTINGQTYATIDDSDIVRMLRAEITNHNLPGADDNRLYVVYVAPNVVVTGPDVNSAQNFTGYHARDTDYTGGQGTLYYAVIVDPTGYPGARPKSAADGLTPLQYDTITAAHELAEAATDADTHFGYRDYNPFSSTWQEEIGDVTADMENGTGWGFALDGFAVQKEWSNNDNANILWGANFTLTNGTLTITGDQEWWNRNDNLTIDQDALGSVTATLNGVTVSFSPGKVTSINVFGGAGTDTININSTLSASVFVSLGSGTDTVNVAPGTKTLNAITHAVALFGGTGHDVLNVFDQANPNPTTYLLTSAAFQSSRSAQITYPASSRDFNVSVHGGGGANLYQLSGSTSRTTTLDTGNGSDVVRVEQIAAGSAVTVNDGTGRTFIYVSPSAGNLDTILGSLTINGGGSDTLVVYDQLNRDTFTPNPLQLPYTFGLTSTTIARTAYTWAGGNLYSYIPHPVSIRYSSLGNIVAYTPPELLAFLNVESTAAGTSTTVVTGAGRNVISVSPTAQNLNNLAGNLTINGGKGVNTLTVNDQHNPYTSTLDKSYSISSTMVTRRHDPALSLSPYLVAGRGKDITMNYSNIASLVINGGGGGNMIQVASTPAATALTVNAGSGDDTIRLLGLPAGKMTVYGQGGINTLDYSAFSTAVSVNLAAHAATGLAGFDGIQNVTGGAGNDSLVGDARNNLLNGGSGNDTLTGGNGNDILLGGSGNDVLSAGPARCLLVGGTGSDSLYGGSADDILVGGTTAYDTNSAALLAIMKEWTRFDRTYLQRKNALVSGGGWNGSTVLNAATVFDDGSADWLRTTSGGLDYVFAGLGDTFH